MMVWKGGVLLSTMEMIDVRANLRGIYVFFSFSFCEGGGVLSIHHCLKVLKMMVSNPPVFMGGI